MSEAENLAKFMQYQMVTASEQDAILKLNGAEMEEILVMKIVLENVNFTVELQNKSSDEFIELREKITETVFFFVFGILNFGLQVLSLFQTLEILELPSKEMPKLDIIEVIPFEKQFPLCFCTLSQKGEFSKFSTLVLGVTF